MRNHDQDFFRAMDILARLSLERTGWRSWFSRWRYSREPLSHDAANLCRSVGYKGPFPNDCRMVGEPEEPTS
jgi:hypothetical protein